MACRARGVKSQSEPRKPLAKGPHWRPSHCLRGAQQGQVCLRHLNGLFFSWPADTEAVFCLQTSAMKTVTLVPNTCIELITGQPPFHAFAKTPNDFTHVSIHKEVDHYLLGLELTHHHPGPLS